MSSYAQAIVLSSLGYLDFLLLLPERHFKFKRWFLSFRLEHDEKLGKLYAYISNTLSNERDVEICFDLLDFLFQFEKDFNRVLSDFFAVFRFIETAPNKDLWLAILKQAGGVERLSTYIKLNLSAASSDKYVNFLSKIMKHLIQIMLFVGSLILLFY